MDCRAPLKSFGECRDVHERPEENLLRGPGMGHRGGAVGRRDHKCLAAETIGGIVFGRVSQVESQYRQPAPFAPKHDLVRRQLGGNLAGFLDLGAGDDFPCAGCQGMDDRGR